MRKGRSDAEIPGYGTMAGAILPGQISHRHRDRLRKVRLEAGITSQEKLAALAGVHRTYIGRLERGDSGVTVDMLAAILAAMSVTLAEFFDSFRKAVSPRTPRQPQ